MRTRLPTSRLALSAALVGAAIVVAVLTAGPAGANDGDPLTLGGSNTADNQTDLITNQSGGFGLHLISNYGGGLGVAASQTAVEARSTGTASDADGVLGATTSYISSGVEGTNSGGGNGVTGTASSSAGGDGVSGEAASSTAAGVDGFNDSSGYGVRGTTANGYGVWGESTGNIGVVGKSSSGVGVHAESATGTALEVSGIPFFGDSGVATVKASKSSVKVTLNETQPLTSQSFILATLQQFRSGVWVAAVVPNVTNHTLTIYLNTPVAQGTKVAWFIADGPTGGGGGP